MDHLLTMIEQRLTEVAASDEDFVHDESDVAELVDGVVDALHEEMSYDELRSAIGDDIGTYDMPADEDAEQWRRIQDRLRRNLTEYIEVSPSLQVPAEAPQRTPGIRIHRTPYQIFTDAHLAQPYDVSEMRALLDQPLPPRPAPAFSLQEAEDRRVLEHLERAAAIISENPEASEEELRALLHADDPAGPGPNPETEVERQRRQMIAALGIPPEYLTGPPMSGASAMLRQQEAEYDAYGRSYVDRAAQMAEAMSASIRDHVMEDGFSRRLMPPQEVARPDTLGTTISAPPPANFTETGSMVKCPSCMGTGKRTRMVGEIHDSVNFEIVSCDACAGTGTILTPGGVITYTLDVDPSTPPGVPYLAKLELD